MLHRDNVTLTKIIDEINIAFELIGDSSQEQFLTDEKLKRAVCMTVINIGELVKNLSENFRLENKSVPWKKIAGFRDIAAHKYATLSMNDVFNTVINDFPELKENIQKILSE